MPLAVTKLVQHRFFWHQDRLRVTGALAKTAPHDTQEWLNHNRFIRLIHLKDIFGANLNTLAAPIAQLWRDGREPGNLLPWNSLQTKRSSI